MNQDDFKSLKRGDEVVLLNANVLGGADFPPNGTILKRRPSWLDDGSTNCFEYEKDGVVDFAYFGFEEVEVVSG